jgi:polysaccharide chain length determinant protein (PEP-CTERM system associated)
VLPGKKYNPEDYLLIVWERKWLLLLPIVVVWAGAFLYARSLPDRYRSQARVLIVPPQVPEDYVRTTVTSTLQERLTAMSQQILSRTRLERIITEFNLYEEERKTRLFEDVIEQMRTKDIKVDMPKVRRREDPGFFTVSYESMNPRTAMQVADRLAALFIAENLQDRAVLAEQTAAFLDAQLENAKRQLDEQDTKLEEFRRANAGRLPSEVSANVQVMQSTQSQLQAVVDALNRDNDRKLQLDRLIADTAAMPVLPAREGADGVAAGATAAERLANARQQLQAMQLRFKDSHPDIPRMKRIIADLEKAAAAEAAEGHEGPTVPLTAAGLAQQRRLIEMQTERESVERRIAIGATEQARLQGILATYRARIEAAPERESELAELSRDYQTLQDQYQLLLKQSQQSHIAADLERRQIGEQFRIIDTARLPERPTGPDRLRINVLGAGAGFAFGLMIIGLLEYRDTSFRTRDDIVTVLSLPVLAVVPLMVTAGELRRSRRRTFALAASVAIALVAIVISAWRLRLIDGWIR